MTREEILRMEAGSELDQLIAERVMEWKEGQKTLLSRRCGVGILGEKALPRYSTDIAAAWEAVEALREKEFVIDILGSLEDFIVKIWNENESEGLSIAKASAEQAPLAICRAALLAVMEAGHAK